MKLFRFEIKSSVIVNNIESDTVEEARHMVGEYIRDGDYIELILENIHISDGEEIKEE